MQVKEILRVKGSRLLSIDPAGRAADAVATMAKENLGSLVVMEQGRIVEVGPETELLRAGGAYSRLYAAQRQLADTAHASPNEVIDRIAESVAQEAR